MSEIKKYKMCLNVATPLHIGSGLELSKLDYVYQRDKRKMTIVDKNKFMEYLSEKNKLDAFIVEVSKKADNIDLYDFLTQNGLKNSIYEFKLREFDSKMFYTQNRMNTIHLMIKNAQSEPYIPGSSIKGAIVNAIAASYLKKNRKKYSQKADEIYDICRKTSRKMDRDYNVARKDIKKIINSILDPLLYAKNSDKGNVKNFALSVSDSYHSENVEIAFLKDYDEARSTNQAKPKEMPISREYILPGAKFYFDINVNFDFFRQAGINIRSMNDMLDLIDDFSYSLVTEEYDLDFPEEIVIENKVKKTYEMRDVIIMGANTGFLQKTVIDSLYEDKQKATEVIRVILHKKSGGKNKNLDHKNDTFSPRVINYVLANDFELAGLCQLKILKSKDIK